MSIPQSGNIYFVSVLILLYRRFKYALRTSETVCHAVKVIIDLQGTIYVSGHKAIHTAVQCLVNEAFYHLDFTYGALKSSSLRWVRHLRGQAVTGVSR